MTGQTPGRPGRDAEQLAEQLRAGVAVITAAHQLRTGQIDHGAFADVVADITREHFAAPVQLALPLAWLALKLAVLVAEMSGSELETVLQWLGVEAASPAR
ncbi:hypothetical protein ACWDUI_23750 [Streptosporangium sandarakinum]